MSDDDVLDVLVIGAGFSGVCTGIKLLENGLTNFRIFEKSHGVGGTWHENTYPGAACDIPSHLYCFSFEPNPFWSRRFAGQAEILAYIEHCIEKYGLTPYISLGRRVVRQQIDRESGYWETTFSDGDEVRSRHVVSGMGCLHQPKIPDLPGRATFQGVAMHTARWNHDYDFRGQRVAVIGSAASAVQAIPELAKSARHIYVFQRTPNYVAPRYDRPYTSMEQKRFRRWPLLNRLLRWYLFLRLDLILFRFMNRRSFLGATAAAQINRRLRRKVHDVSLHDALSPQYRIGCKRILISDDFYATLNRDHVSLVASAIQQIDQSGVQSKDGTHYHVDAIIFATGFDLEKHMVSIDIIGENGLQLRDVWSDLPKAYRGVCVAGFPNYWFVTGPNTIVGTNSMVFMIEQAVHFIIQCMRLAGDGSLISVKSSAMDRYNHQLQLRFQQTVWAAGGCDSWYRSEDGRIATLYPFNVRTWRRQMRRVPRQDFEIRSRLALPHDANSITLANT